MGDDMHRSPRVLITGHGSRKVVVDEDDSDWKGEKNHQLRSIKQFRMEWRTAVDRTNIGSNTGFALIARWEWKSAERGGKGRRGKRIGHRVINGGYRLHAVTDGARGGHLKPEAGARSVVKTRPSFPFFLSLFFPPPPPLDHAALRFFYCPNEQRPPRHAPLPRGGKSA